ncbi:uncharacterized protein LOC117315548 [Pecten maximus]|uniref:uncharacterized protein LOC117315548 n=1 Tax=Pecten maximus TaxID=6579 RepID=UPI001458FA29|nr:uncharacterized protein LOC117315548 [Pecten maximus]
MATGGIGAWQSMSADPNCVCEGGFGEVTSIVKSPLFYGAGMGVLPGLSHQDTAILAGVLTGLATFLFLAIPILCCLCPFPCLCCGGAGGKSSKAMAAAAGGATKRKEKHMHDGISGRSTDVESIMSFRSFDKNWDKLDKVDYDNLYEVDMKLPRVWLETLRGVPDDQIDGRLQELEATNWQGTDMHRSSEGRHGGYDEGRDMQTLERNMTMESSGGYGTGGGGYGTGGGGYGTGGGNGHIYSTSTSGRDGGQVLEWETTRQINIAASELPEQEYIYEREFRQEMNGMERDNFMKIYQTYRRMLDDSKQTAF